MGAWAAGRDLLRELAPDLQALVTEMLPSDASFAQGRGAFAPQSATLDVALDALIQLRAITPPAWARTVLDARPAQALILLSFMDTRADDVLRDLAMNTGGHTWLVAENLLLAHRAPGTAVTLLSGLKLTGVLDVKRADAKAGVGQGGSIPGSGRPDVAMPGFPSVARYATYQGCASGCVMLVDGPTPVYYERTVAPAGVVRPGFDRPAPSPPGAGLRLRYRARLLETASAPQQPLPLSEYEIRSTAWRDQATLDAEVARFRADILSKYEETIGRLTSAGLLTPAEAASLPKPAVDVVVRSVQ